MNNYEVEYTALDQINTVKFKAHGFEGYTAFGEYGPLFIRFYKIKVPDTDSDAEVEKITVMVFLAHLVTTIENLDES